MARGAGSKEKTASSRGLHTLSPAKGSVRGRGSGLGKTSGRGEKGQKSRSGYSRKIGFEGGQMPLHRRVPKRGFHNRFRKEYACVNVGQLEAFEAGTIVTPEVLQQRGVVKKMLDGLKVLADGELSKALTVRAHKFSARALEIIVAKGGKAEVIERTPRAEA
jgi:large subunit ribosomal protein L15